MTDFVGSRTVSCKTCGRPYNTAEGPQCECGRERGETLENPNIKNDGRDEPDWGSEQTSANIGRPLQ